MTGRRGARDRLFLARTFQKLLINFTWWVNRKDAQGRHIFGGGFLGMDNIGVFDRDQPLPTGGSLAQVDGTAWMATLTLHMLEICVELTRHDPSYVRMLGRWIWDGWLIANALGTPPPEIIDMIHANGATTVWPDASPWPRSMNAARTNSAPIGCR